MEEHEQLKDFDSHGKNGGWVASNLEPALESDATIKGQVGRKAVSITANNLAVGIVIKVNQLRQALSESLVFIKPPLKDKVSMVKIEPALLCDLQHRTGGLNQEIMTFLHEI
jgi:hypothetical protein